MDPDTPGFCVMCDHLVVHTANRDCMHRGRVVVVDVDQLRAVCEHCGGYGTLVDVVTNREFVDIEWDDFFQHGMLRRWDQIGMARLFTLTHVPSPVPRANYVVELDPAARSYCCVVWPVCQLNSELVTRV